MEIQFVPTHDSDDEGWLEVLEGSPGPSLPASPTIESITSTESVLVELEVTDSTWESDEMLDFEEAVDESDAERKSNLRSHLRQFLTRYSSTEQHIPSPIDMRLPRRLPPQSLLDRPLRLDRPEIGDIIGHCHEVYGKCLNKSEEADYYQSWLCWMYCMTWNQIWDLVSHAPNYVVHAANHLFGLRNHPFWSHKRTSQTEWHSMHVACRDILNWWKESRLSYDPHRNAIRFGTARHTMAPSGVPHSDEIELYYGLPHSPEKQVTEQPTSHQENIATADQFVKVKHRIAVHEEMQKGLNDGPDEFRDTPNSFSSSHKCFQPLTDTKEYKHTASSEQTGTLCALPWSPHQVINYVIRKYHSFDKRHYDEVIRYEICFETWVHWNQHMYKNGTHYT